MGTAETDRLSRYVCAPLEGGFGHTLGVAMRRTLLEAIGGTAIVAARVPARGQTPPADWMTALRRAVRSTYGSSAATS